MKNFNQGFSFFPLKLTVHIMSIYWKKFQDTLPGYIFVNKYFKLKSEETATDPPAPWDVLGQGPSAPLTVHGGTATLPDGGSIISDNIR